MVRNIGICAHDFLLNTGANDYLKIQIRALDFDPDNKIFLLVPPENQAMELIRRAADGDSSYSFYREAAPNLELIECEFDSESFRALMRDRGIDIFYPSGRALDRDIPFVTYWPDCQPKHLPEFFDDEAQAIRDGMILRLLQTNKYMITNSQSVVNDMKAFYNAGPDQVHSLPFAPTIDTDYLFPHTEKLLKYKLPKKYFLISSQFWIHKSIETVYKAIRICKDRGMDVKFVFTGRVEEPRRPEYITRLEELVRKTKIASQIQILGLLPKRDQIEIMKGAIAVIQPTLFEGAPGGGAVHDAMALGIRAIVSDIAVNKEIPSSDDVFFFEAKNEVSLADKIEEVLSVDHELPSFEQQFGRSRHSLARLSEVIGRVMDLELGGKK
ncbi:glycosyltransferase [Shinella sedimenti]|uniref:Glycosyltransferase n=1 Tax=Shinella sedimenti TaxID=2919913 RepID=A0ABT0CS19_9HYPH|nr:glycosyltransferase [Shinella sedimenti]MCJ8151402.1 glycosyltransferase [Shinella sedimenti]